MPKIPTSEETRFTSIGQIFVQQGYVEEEGGVILNGIIPMIFGYDQYICVSDQI